MKNILLIVIVSFLGIIITSEAQTMDKIVPFPQKYEDTGGDYLLNDYLTISYSGGDSEKMYSIAMHIIYSLQDYHNITAQIIEGDDGDISLNVMDGDIAGVPENSMKEAYKLVINSRHILIDAPTMRGVFYGVMSLVQLIERNDHRELDGCTITDWPDLPVRGISDDISRGQVSTIDNFKRIIGEISRYKMNTYMPYMEDMLLFDKYPEIGKNRGALTRAEIDELIAFADKHFVDVIPIFQTLGHYENILADEKYLKYAEFPGAASLAVTEKETYEFLEDLLVEVFEMFPSEYFHIGADESFDVGRGKSQELVDSTGIAEVHAEHYNKIYKICKEHGKKVIMYGDIILRHPKILELIPDDITIVDWHYGAYDHYPSTETFNKYGFDYYVSPSVWNFKSTFPTYYLAIPNIKYIIRSGLDNGADGMINSNWGDYGAETFKEFVLYGYAWSAQCAWNLETSDINKFNKSYFRDFFNSDDERIIEMYHTLSDPNYQSLWHEIWRHPALPVRVNPWWLPRLNPVSRIEYNKWAPEFENDLISIKDGASRNEKHIDMLYHIMQFSEWYNDKMEIQLMIQELREGSFVNTGDLLERLKTNRDELLKLKEDYTGYWRDFYKPANLELIEDKFDRLNIYYNDIITELETKGTVSSPLIESEWMYAVTPDSQSVAEAVFKKEFEITDSVESAYLQLIGDTHVKLYINDEYVGQVYVRRSLSLRPEYDRIKLFNITENLKTGKNVIRLKARNYNSPVEKQEDYITGRPAGTNVTAEIITAKEKIELMSGADWKVKIGEEWYDATVLDYPFEIIGPDFDAFRPGWIER